ncbi:MAG: Ig-like domain-containing protein [Chitinophagales bacterium]|nr:Ig-like domain-containing protein [Chitinophagales bacterium]
MSGLFKILITIGALFLLISVGVEVYGQCPSTGCTSTINGADPSNYTVNSGQKLCLAAGADYTGTITMNGGILENCATNPQTFNILYSADTNSVVNNYGSMIFSNLDVDYGTFNNYGTITENNGLDVRNEATFNNYDSIYVSNAMNSRNSATFNNYGSALIQGNFDQLDASLLFNYGNIVGNSRFKSNYDVFNQGSITINGLWDNLNPGRIFTNNGGCINVTDWDNKKTVVGLTCGTITISSNSNNTGSGIITGNIAVVDLTPPGGPPYVDANSGTIDPSVQWASCGCPAISPSPFAIDDVVLVYHDITTDITVLSNDWSIDTVNVSVVDSPLSAAVVANLNGSISYTPDPGFVGRDTFTYEVCDTSSPSKCDTAIVFVTVACSNFDADTLSGFVFDDHTNADGIFDPAETAANNVKLYLYDDVNASGSLDGGDVMIDSTYSGVDGSYIFLINVPKDSLPIQANSDDAEQEVTSGNTFTWSNDLDFGYLNQGPPSGPYIVGMRFQNINIPSTAVITNAYIEFTSYANHSTGVNLSIYGELNATPGTFTDGSGNYDISGRTSTANTTNWDSLEAWQTDSLYQSPDLTPIVQELIDLPAWSAGNSMVFIIDGGLGKRECYSHDLDPAKSPRLVIEFAYINETDHYIIEVDTNSLPPNFTLTTPLLQTAALYTCGGEIDTANNFGYVVAEVCNNSVDDDGDGLVDCDDTLDCRPTTPGIITASNTSVCENTTGETYSITAVAGATSYVWTAPVGATITSGQGTTSITVDFGNSTGDVCVQASNGSCLSLSSCIEITVINSPGQPPLILH